MWFENFLVCGLKRLCLQFATDSLLKEIDKLETIRQLELPEHLFTQTSPKIVQHYRQRASTEPPRELRRHPQSIRYTLMAAFCWQRKQEITDSLVELLIQIVHQLRWVVNHSVPFLLLFQQALYIVCFRKS